jgi:hypothetical protein
MKLFTKIISLFLFLATAAPIAAQAADIPVVTWQRGREQQIVIAEGSLNRQWRVTLEGNDQLPLAFTGSKKDAKGFVVYSVDIPEDFPLGSYQVFTEADGQNREVVAGVQVINAITVTAANNLFDLTLIIVIFAILTSIVSTIRMRKYSYIPFNSSQVVPGANEIPSFTDENFWDRLERAPYRVRVNWLQSMRQSLLRFLLIREGELSHNISKNLYGVLPLVGIFAGAIAGIEVEKHGGFYATPLTFLVAVTLLAILDGLTGISATLGLWAALLATGNLTSIRDLLIAFSVGLSWVGASLFASLLRELIRRDFHNSESPTATLNALGTFGSAIVGTSVFYLGQALVNSVIYVEHPVRAIAPAYLVIVCVGLVARGFADYVILNRDGVLRARNESITIARVISPLTSTLVFTSIISFVFIWTNSFVKALIVATTFTLPYVLSFLAFKPTQIFEKISMRRNIVIEAAVVAAVTLVIYREISQTPFLVDKRAMIFLVLSSLAPAIHALWSALSASSEAKFPNEENVEII